MRPQGRAVETRWPDLSTVNNKNTFFFRNHVCLCRGNKCIPGTRCQVPGIIYLFMKQAHNVIINISISRRLKKSTDGGKQKHHTNMVFAKLRFWFGLAYESQPTEGNKNTNMVFAKFRFWFGSYFSVLFSRSQKIINFPPESGWYGPYIFTNKSNWVWLLGFRLGSWN